MSVLIDSITVEKTVPSCLV